MIEFQNIIKEANKATFDPSQKLFASIAKDFVHLSPPLKKKKPKKRTGQIKRHKFRKAKGVTNGFGKTWGGETKTFRVELSWLDQQTDDQDNEVLHWVECRKFSGKLYQLYRQYFSESEDWRNGETVESKFVNRYIANWLILNREKQRLNQAFIFPATKKRDEEIRELLYRIIWNGDLPNYSPDAGFQVVVKNNIWHVIADSAS